MVLLIRRPNLRMGGINLDLPRLYAGSLVKHYRRQVALLLVFKALVLALGLALLPAHGARSLAASLADLLLATAVPRWHPRSKILSSMN
jgi:hypothetical protein